MTEVLHVKHAPDSEQDYPTEGNNNGETNHLRGSDDQHSDSGNAAEGDEAKLPMSKNAPPAPPPPRDVLVGPWLFVVMAVVALVFTTVSIGIPWYEKKQRADSTLSGSEEIGKFYLFKSTYKVAGVTTERKPKDLCWPVKRRVIVMEAFAIASAVFCLATVALGVAHAVIITNKVVRNAALLLTAFTFACLTILVSFNFNVYFWSFKDCGAGSSYHSQLYEPHAGFGLTVTAWVLIGLGGIIEANDFTLPADARAVDKSIKVFTLLALIAFLFSTVSCPIVHWFYKSEAAQRTTDVLLWRLRDSRFMWDVLSPVKNRTITLGSLQCPELKRYFIAAEAFSVIAIFFNCLAGATGLLLWKSLVGTRVPAAVFAYVGCIMSLVAMALELAIYYGSWCGGRYRFSHDYYVLSSGFGLTAAAFVVMALAAGAATVAVVLTSRYFPALAPRKSVKDVAIEECQ